MAPTRFNDRYRLLQLLGAGTDAQVFLVADEAEGDRHRALKLVRALDPGARQRLAGEFKRMAALRHPALVRVHSLETLSHPVQGAVAGAPFFIADYVDGLPPTTAVQQAEDPTACLLTIAEDITAALTHIHAAGLVHCDVKPANMVALPSGGARLLDMGLSAVRGLAGAARGSLAYMAPEALAGEIDPRGDLYSLGASLFELASGHAPFAADTAAELTRAICRGATAPLRVAAPWLPNAMVELITTLLHKEPLARHSSAQVLLADLARVREGLGYPPREPAGGAAAAALLPPRMVGRDSELAALGTLLAATAEGRAEGSPVVRLCGPPGVGRRSIARQALRRHQLAVLADAALPLSVLCGELDEVLAAARSGATAARPQLPQHPPGSRIAWIDAAVATLTRRAASEPLAVLLTNESDHRVGDLLRALDQLPTDINTGSGAGALSVLAPTAASESLPPLARTAAVTVAPLSPPLVASMAESMLGRPIGSDWARELSSATGGLPRLIAEVVRTAAGDDPAQTERQAPRELVAATDAAEFEALVVHRATLLPRIQVSLLEALAVHGGHAAVAMVAATLDAPAGDIYAAASELAGRGMVAMQAEQLLLPSEVHTRALGAAIPAARRKALHRAAMKALEASGALDAVQRARHRLQAGPAKAIASDCLAAADALLVEGQIEAACELTQQAAEAATGGEQSEALVLLAERATSLGRYDDAVAAAARAARSRSPERRRRALLALARAAHKRGTLDEAEASLDRLLQEDPHNDETIGTYACLLVARGRYQEAASAAGEVSGPGAAESLTVGNRLRLEAAGLAKLYLGKLPAADEAFELLEHGARTAHHRADLGRALALRGMVAHARGDVSRAADLYAAAHTEAHAACDLHAAAVYAMNRAAALQERGRHGDAVLALDGALRQLERIGATAQRAAALFNRGNSLLAIGELEAARRAADQALQEARTHELPEIEVYAQLLTGDVARREGAHSRAAEAYRRATVLAEQSGHARIKVLSLLNCAEAAAESGDRKARTALVSAAAIADSTDERDLVAVSQARVALALGDELHDAQERLRATRSHLRDAGRVDMSWRADLLAARLAAAQGDRDAARRHLKEAMQLQEELLRAAPEHHRSGLRRDPDAVALTALADELRSNESPRPGVAPASPAPSVEPRLRRLLALSRRLNSELRLDRLLDDVIDTVIESTTAERGFLLLLEGERLRVAVARNFDHSEMDGQELQVSRSIAERAALTGETVLTVDAAYDERFDAAASVAALQLRSVLAVPLRQKGRVTGTIYVDHRFRRGAFDDDAVDLVRELADIAAIAIENARLVHENQRRQQEITQLNEQLEQEVEKKETELATVKARLGRGGGELRHGYDAIVGRSPAMVDMLRIIDRATETSLPVVISGESGTGKELVARALHDNGPRANAPFVAVNCGALPEALLESELFGHARGAFTGAERDRRGLFEVASNGTLFLDEVADTTPAMQTKLLRVLQAGEIRRVGDECTRKVDVRIVAASNRELRPLVDAGAFREDLFYRLNVLHVRVPALRERIEDIPEITQALLAKGQTIERAALSKLCAYPWPGNVRELENELARASALAGDTITVNDLSPMVVTAQRPTAATKSDDLALKPQVEALERSLVEEAMTRAGGNQTAAAKLLGLSRYGLQKKLKRYGIAGS